MNDFLQCKVCHEKYDKSLRIPLSLPCGHTFCEYCLKNIISSNIIKCPLDKKSFNFPKLSDIPKNDQVLTALSPDYLEKGEKCETHKNQIIRFFCLKEKERICQDCLLSNHLNHIQEVTDIKNFICLQKFKEDISKSETENEKNIAKLSSFYSQLKKDHNEFIDNLNLIEKKIKKTLDNNYSEISMLQQKKFNEKERVLSLKKLDLMMIKKDCKEKLNEVEKNMSIDLVKLKSIQDFLNEKEIALQNNEDASSTHRKNSMVNDPDWITAFLSGEKKHKYLEIQIPNYDSKNYKLLSSLFESGKLKSKFLIKTLLQVNIKNYIRKEDIDKAFDDKPLKLQYNMMMPSTSSFIKAIEELKPWEKEKGSALIIGGCNGYIPSILYLLMGKESIVRCSESISEIIDISKKNIDENNKDLSSKITFSKENGKGPYDIIYINQTVQSVSEEIENLLNFNGKMFVSIGANRSYTSYIIDKDLNGATKMIKLEEEAPVSSIPLRVNAVYQFLDLF